MKPKLPVSRLSAIERPVTGISSRSRVADTGKRQDPGRSVPEESGISLKVERHSQWALLSRAQIQLSDMQRSEQAIVTSYRELLSLKRQLERTGSQSQALATRVSELRRKLEQSNSLDNNLRLQESPPRNQYRLDRVDLLSSRSQPENLQIRLPDGGQVAVRLEAGNTEEENLATLKQAFARYRISVFRTPEGQLGLTGTAEQLASPWLFRGQGVRVPAGQPVPVQLTRELSELEKLEQGLGNGEREVEKQRLKQLLAVLEQERRQLESQRQQLLQQIRQLRAAGSSAADPDLSAAIRDLLVEGDFNLQLNALLAQANVSRFSVVALLGR